MNREVYCCTISDNPQAHLNACQSGWLDVAKVSFIVLDKPNVTIPLLCDDKLIIDPYSFTNLEFVLALQ